MIYGLKGIVKEISDATITLDTGVLSFGLQVPQPGSFHIGQQIELLTHMHWNQENGPALFGFGLPLEKSVFLLITSCSGVGPKLGMAILAQLGAASFLEAVQSGNESALSAVSGIGSKKAEQIIVQLKHKVAKLVESGIDLGANPTLEKRNEISQVLKSLNYSRQEITAAMGHINEQYPGSAIPFDQLIRHALAYLAKRA